MLIKTISTSALFILLLAGCRISDSPRASLERVSRFEEAYEAIRRDSAMWEAFSASDAKERLKLGVSSELICSQLTSFVDLLPSQSPAESREGKIRRFMALDRAGKSKCGTALECGEKLKSLGDLGSEKSDYRLFFSELKENFLYVEAVRTGDNDGCYGEVARYTESVRFVFEFRDGKIVDTWSSHVSVD